MNNRLSRRSFLKGLGAAASLGALNMTGLGKISALAARRYQDLPRLIYLFPGSPQADVQRVQDALSAYLAERIGATIELRAVDWGAYDQQIGLMNAAGESYDLAFTAPWINAYSINAQEEYLAPLQDLLPSLAPNYWASMTPETWEAARVNGSIYAGINQQIFVKPFGVTLRNDVLEQLGLGDSLAGLSNYADLDSILAAVKEYVDQDDTLQYMTYDLAGVLVNREIWGFDPQPAGLVVRSTDASAQVLIYSATDEYRQAAELIRRWRLAGYAPPDVQTADQIDAAWQAGQCALDLASVVKPGGDAETGASLGYPVTSKAIAQPILTTSGIVATLNGIGSLSPNIELAVRYLELINTDPVFYNTLCKGLEGVHWEWADRDQLLIRPANGAASFDETGYNPGTDWMYGNVFNSYYIDPTQVGSWPATAELNRTAQPSPLLGFNFDGSAVETEVASITSIAQEYATPIENGLVDLDPALSAYNQRLIDAGIERVRDEMQRQIDSWKSQ